MSDLTLKFLIDGKLEGDSSEETIPTEDPARGTKLADVPVANDAAVDATVAAARNAFESEWRFSDAERRSAVLREIADLINDNSQELIKIDLVNNGSIRSVFENEDVELATSWLEYYAGLTREIKGETIDTQGKTLNFTLREPRGVVAGIIPFNHPFMFAASKIAATLATGNTLVLKPSEYTPLSLLKLGEYISYSETIPDGIVNIVAGGGETGARLSGHTDVDMVDFQGSVSTGKKVMQSASETISPVTLELGGKNPFVIFPDMNVATAVDGCLTGMRLLIQGQSCGAGTRVLVHEDIHEEFVDRLVAAFESVKVGMPEDPNVEMGAMVSRDHYERILEYIEVGKETDAKLRTGGEPAKVDEEGASGYFIEPTVFDNVNPDSRIAQEEIFGPVVGVIPWSDYDEMIEIANGTNFGLTASVWTNNLKMAHETIRRLKAGYVWVNQHGRHYMGTPFGGFKQSGIGRLHCMQELYEHTETKNVNIHIDNSRWEWKP